MKTVSSLGVCLCDETVCRVWVEMGREGDSEWILSFIHNLDG